MTSIDRIRAICKEQKKPISALEKECKFGNAYFSKLKKGKVPYDRLVKVANNLGVSVDYLLCGEEAGRSADRKSDLERKFLSLDEHGASVVIALLNAEYERCISEQDNIVEFPTIRHYLSSPAAGANGQVAGEDYEDIPRPLDCPKDADYCLTVNGDSMEPYIPDGSMVYVKRDAPINDLDVGVFCVDGATYVKQYTLSYDGSVYLLSANPKREEANIKLSKNGSSGMFCLGKVLLKKKLPMPVYEP